MIDLTDTERETLAEAICDPAHLHRWPLVGERRFCGRCFDDVPPALGPLLAARDARVRAAALAPIQALRDEISRSMNLSYGDGRLALVALDLDAALAATLGVSDE